MAKSVLVTGCSDGTIGNALALEFARRGWAVYATARKTTSMENLGKQGITLIALDINDGDAVRAARDRIAKDTGGRLDVLLSNAGVRHCMMAVETDPRDGGGGGGYPDARDAAIFATNVTATMAVTRVFTPLLVAAGGTVALQGSLSARVPGVGNAAYCASKAALEMYSRALRIEMRPLGVRVCFLLTGFVRSNMTAQRIEYAPGSYYAPVAGKIQAGYDRWEGDVVEPDKYARYVVAKVAQKNPPELVWRGGGWFLVWLTEKTGSGWLTPHLLARWHGLDTPLV